MYGDLVLIKVVLRETPSRCLVSVLGLTPGFLPIHGLFRLTTVRPDSVGEVVTLVAYHSRALPR